MKYCSYPLGLGKQLSPLDLKVPIDHPSKLTVKGLVACKVSFKLFIKFLIL